MIEFVKFRPTEFDVNYKSDKLQQTLFDLVIVKCPSYFKVKFFIDLGYDLMREYALSTKVIEALNKTEVIKYDEKVKIVNEIVKRTDLVRWVEFMKVYVALKESQVNNELGRALGSLNEDKIREIIKYI